MVLPSWVGDVVMGTPTLRALRLLYPHARITYLLKDYVRPVVDALPWHDRLIVVRKRKPGGKPPPLALRLTARLRRRRFDLAVLMPNSFRSALLISRVGIARRLGYDRDGRGVLLTDRLLPIRDKGKFVPISTVDYYLGLAGYLGGDTADKRLRLFTRAADDDRARRLLEREGVAVGQRPIVLLNPGAATKGEAKLWPAQRYAALADRMIEKHGAQVLLNGSPNERPILDAVHAASNHRLTDLQRAGGDLTLLKSICRMCDLLVTNDTGARHIAAAMGTSVVCLFGPTDPQWTTLCFEHERVVVSGDGKMSWITVEQAVTAAEELLRAAHAPSPDRPPR